MKRVLFSLVFVAGSVNAQQGAYITLPAQAQPKPSTLVGDVARAYASGNAQAQAQATEETRDPGRAPSVIEVSPGVFHFDTGTPPGPVAKPAVTQPNTPPKGSAPASAGIASPGTDIRSVAPPAWRIGLYGGSQPAADAASDGAAAISAQPVSAQVQPVETPPVARSVGTTPAIAPAGSAPGAASNQSSGKDKAATAEGAWISPKLPGWPSVR
jgi:hypothetical protein